MPRSKKHPDALAFKFVENPEKTLAKMTLANYKRHLNSISTFSNVAHKADEEKPLIQTKEHLIQYPDYVLSLLKDNIKDRLKKSATLAAVFYTTGRLDQNHPYVTEFRRLYYKDNPPAL